MPRKKLKNNSSQRNSRLQGFNSTDYVMALTVIALTVFGVVMVYNTSVIVAFEEFGDRFWFLKRQAVWAILGITAGFVVSGVNYHWWKKVAFPGIVVSVILLVLVFIPGFSNEVYGARQRLVVPFLNVFLQPAEIAKVALIVYLAALFDSAKQARQKYFPHKEFFMILVLIGGLVALEPDLGGALLIFASAFSVYFMAGAPLFYLLFIGIAGSLAAIGYTFSSNYRMQRVLTFLNPTSDPQGVSYQITQILIALGSGGLLGVGLGNSRQKYQYIPEVTTDSIFAILGEELGLLGALLIIGALAFIIWRGFSIGAQAKDEFGKLLAVGITANIGFQTVVNLGGMVGLLPLTGVPLPFISYGGSSLTILLISVGILLNISRSL